MTNLEFGKQLFECSQRVKTESKRIELVPYVAMYMCDFYEYNSFCVGLTGSRSN